MSAARLLVSKPTFLKLIFKMDLFTYYFMESMNKKRDSGQMNLDHVISFPPREADSVHFSQCLCVYFLGNTLVWRTH